MKIIISLTWKFSTTKKRIVEKVNKNIKKKTEVAVRIKGSDSFYWNAHNALYRGQ